jgi:pimeloyl-ACP methyl ester carboxylesterase
MIEVRQIETAPNLVFDVLVGGPDDGPPVLMLHGFCVSRHFWKAQVDALDAAGYRAVAPNQRGYAVGARPNPVDLDAYFIDRLLCDALDIIAALGRGAPRFHLVGHDWGGSLFWDIAQRWPERVASLTMLSRPHPRSFTRALAMPDGEQAHRSRHHKAFLDAKAGPELLAVNAKWVRDRLTRAGVPACRQHKSRLTFPCSALQGRWRQRWRGTGHAACGTHRLAPPKCRRFTSGVTRTTQWAELQPKGPPNTSMRHTASCLWQGSGITPRTRCRSSALLLEHLGRHPV